MFWQKVIKLRTYEIAGNLLFTRRPVLFTIDSSAEKYCSYCHYNKETQRSSGSTPKIKPSLEEKLFKLPISF